MKRLSTNPVANLFRNLLRMGPSRNVATLNVLRENLFIDYGDSIERQIRNYPLLFKNEGLFTKYREFLVNKVAAVQDGYDEDIKKELKYIEIDPGSIKDAKSSKHSLQYLKPLIKLEDKASELTHTSIQDLRKQAGFTNPIKFDYQTVNDIEIVFKALGKYLAVRENYGIGNKGRTTARASLYADRAELLLAAYREMDIQEGTYLGPTIQKPAVKIGPAQVRVLQERDAAKEEIKLQAR